jgi:hypothetical protein
MLRGRCRAWATTVSPAVWTGLCAAGTSRPPPSTPTTPSTPALCSPSSKVGQRIFFLFQFRKGTKFTGISALLWIRIGFNANPDAAFYLNAYPDPDPGSQTNADPDPEPV